MQAERHNKRVRGEQQTEQAVWESFWENRHSSTTSAFPNRLFYFNTIAIFLTSLMLHACRAGNLKQVRKMASIVYLLEHS